MEEIFTAMMYGSLMWVIYTMFHSITKYKFMEKPIIKCLKCTTFWGVLVLTVNPLIAATSSLMNYIIENTVTTRL